MEKRIVLEKRGRNPDQIDELNLDNCRSTYIDGLTDEFVNLKVLCLNNVGLTSLKGFPKLPNLTKLELSDNRISSGLNLLNTSPKLTTLNLSGNKIKDLEALKPLKEFAHLKAMDLFNNEVTSVENYREKTFKLIPSLKYLDGFDANEEHEESEEADSINGNEEEDFADFGDEEDDENDDIEEEELGLDAVYKDNLDEESEGDDYEGEGSEDEDEEIEDEEETTHNDTEEESTPRGKKRKHEGEEDVN